MSDQFDGAGMKNLQNSYEIRLLIKHPNMRLDLLGDALNLRPTLAWNVGSERFSPKGRKLDGLHRESVWSHSYKEMSGKNIEENIDRILSIVELHDEAIRNISYDGGSVSIIVNVSGHNHIGEEIGWNLLSRISALRCRLGFEVFPGGL